VLLSAGTRLGPRQIGVAAATGYDRVAVHRRPVIGMVTTGNELLEVHQLAAPYHTRDSNGPMLLAALRQAGFADVTSTIVPDSLHATIEVIVRVLKESDAVIVSGGVSAGRYDCVPRPLPRRMHRSSTGVAMKPGRPQLFAKSASHQPIFGLPGNPLSAIVGFYDWFCRPCVCCRVVPLQVAALFYICLSGLPYPTTEIFCTCFLPWLRRIHLDPVSTPVPRLVRRILSRRAGRWRNPACAPRRQPPVRKHGAISTLGGIGV